MISSVATGSGTTCTLAKPVFPSLVAVMRALPGASAVTTPAAVTVATLGASLANVSGRFVKTLPALSVICVRNVSVDPMISEETLGVTATVPARRAGTTTMAEPTRPSLDAEMVAVPGCSAITFPVAVTAATVTLLELQLTSRPASSTPPASRSAAANWRSVPTAMVSCVGLNVTV